MRERGSATDTCRSTSVWPNEVRGTRWTRIWPDSIIYSHALFSELFKAWKVVFDLCEWAACRSNLWRAPLLRTVRKFSFDIQTKSKNQTKPTQKHLQTRTARCTLQRPKVRRLKVCLMPCFFGQLHPHEYTHYSKYFWMEWALIKSTWSSSWFES